MGRFVLMQDSKKLRDHWHKLMAESVADDFASQWSEEFQGRFERNIPGYPLIFEWRQ